MVFYELDKKDKACEDFKKAADLKYKRAVNWIKDKNKFFKYPRRFFSKFLRIDTCNCFGGNLREN